MKKLLAVLCFVPVGLMVLIYAVSVYGISKLSTHCVNSDPDAFQLAARWNSNELYYRRKRGGTWEPWEPWVEFGETMKSINSHLHENKEAQ